MIIVFTRLALGLAKFPTVLLENLVCRYASMCLTLAAT